MADASLPIPTPVTTFENENKSIPDLIPKPKDMADTLLNAMYANLVTAPSVRDRKKHMKPEEVKALFQQSSYSFVLFQSLVRLYYTMFNQMCAYMARFRVQYLARTPVEKRDRLTKTQKATLLKMQQRDTEFASNIIQFALFWVAQNRDARTGQPPPIEKVFDFLGITKEFMQSEFRVGDACWNCSKMLIDPKTGEVGGATGKFCDECGASTNPDANLGLPYIDLIRSCEAELKKMEKASTQLPPIVEEKEEKKHVDLPKSQEPVVRHFKPCATCGCVFEQANHCNFCSEPWNQPWYKVDEHNSKLWRNQHQWKLRDHGVEGGCEKCHNLAVHSSGADVGSAGSDSQGTSQDSLRPETDPVAESPRHDAGCSETSGRIEPTPPSGDSSSYEPGTDYTGDPQTPKSEDSGVAAEKETEDLTHSVWIESVGSNVKNYMGKLDSEHDFI